MVLKRLDETLLQYETTAGSKSGYSRTTLTSLTSYYFVLMNLSAGWRRQSCCAHAWRAASSSVSNTGPTRESLRAGRCWWRLSASPGMPSLSSGQWPDFFFTVSYFHIKYLFWSVSQEYSIQAFIFILVFLSPMFDVMLFWFVYKKYFGLFSKNTGLYFCVCCSIFLAFFGQFSS